MQQRAITERGLFTLATVGLQVLSIGLGVGLSAVLGMLKFHYNLPLKALIAGSLVPTIAAACWMQW